MRPPAGLLSDQLHANSDIRSRLRRNASCGDNGRANNRKRRRFLPNLHTHRFWLEGEKRWVTLRISTNAMRTIEKKGLEAVLAEMHARGEKI